MKTTHLTAITWNLCCQSLDEKRELLAYAAEHGIVIGREVDATDLGLGWNDRQDKLYSFPAADAGQYEPGTGRHPELITAEQFRALVAAEAGPTYGVTLVAEAPAPGLTYEQFAHEAQVRAWVLGTQYGVSAQATGYPARPGCAVYTAYEVLVYDLSAVSEVRPLGKHVADAYGRTPEACLAVLGNKLRDMEQQALGAAEAESLTVDAQVEATELALAA